MVKNHLVVTRIPHLCQKYTNDAFQVREYSKIYQKKDCYFQLFVVLVGSSFLFIAR